MIETVPLRDEVGAPESGHIPHAGRVARWQGGRVVYAIEAIADEVPVALVFGGVPHAVMMATPADLEDFAVGFTLSESIVGHAAEIQSVRVERQEDGYRVDVDIPSERQFLLATRQRNLTGRTGCGLCGTRTLAEAVRPSQPVGRGLTVAPTALHAAAEGLTARQPLNALTGATHAAAWATPDGAIHCVREDVGRHNALDKLIGALVRGGFRAEDGFVLLTSRASFEMVQKAAAAGVELVAALSAPTALAVAHAESAGMTLIAFVRSGRHTVYSHPQRIHAGLEMAR